MVEFQIEKILDDPQELKKMARDNRNKRRKEPMGKVLDLLRQGVKLGYSVTGQNTADFEDKTLKVVSPRFLSVLPEDDNQTVSYLFKLFFSLKIDLLKSRFDVPKSRQRFI